MMNRRGRGLRFKGQRLRGYQHQPTEVPTAVERYVEQHKRAKQTVHNTKTSMARGQLIIDGDLALIEKGGEVERG
jgi:ribosomal 50S subunit-associated protein YjgA (DUF615 family)